MGQLWQDLRYALRTFRRSPGFVAVAVVSLALGIGANATIFTLVNAVMLRPVPGRAPDELVRVYRNEHFSPHSYPQYADYRDRNDVFAALAAHRFRPLSFSRNGESEVLVSEVVSGNYFEVLGLRPAHGRFFLPEEDRTPGTHPVAVVSYRFWQQQLGGAADLSGATILLNNLRFTVVGVAPEGFHSTYAGPRPELWVPFQMYDSLVPARVAMLTTRRAYGLEMLGRLKPGVTLEQAQASLRVLESQLIAENPFPGGPEPGERPRLTLVPASRVHSQIRTPVMVFFTLLLTVVGLVLLIACSNLAGVLLARASERRREIAIRTALGAGRWRLIRQLLTESTALALAGGALGLALARWASGLLMAFQPPVPLPMGLELSVDARVLLFTFLLSLATGVLFGLLPAWQASRSDLTGALKDEGGLAGVRRSRLRSGLVVAQVALSLVLLIAAGLFLRSLRNATNVDVGFATENRLVLSLNLDHFGYDADAGRALYQRLLERAGGLPGVHSASMAHLVPLSLSRTSTTMAPPATNPEEVAVQIDFVVVTPGYFRTLDLPLVRGREFTAADRAGAPRVVILNETLARRFWPDQDPVGQVITYSAWDDATGRVWVPLEIVGVARDAKYNTLGEAPVNFAYFPLGQMYRGEMALFVHSAGDPHALAAPLRQLVREADPRLAVFDVKTLEENMEITLFPARVGGVLLGIFGGLALLLAAVGLYGVIAYLVAQRTREIGVRMALGARPGDVARLVVGQGMKLALAGTAIGLAVALASTHLLRTFLYGISPTDPVVFAAIALLLAVVAAAAAAVPAWRAARTDPAIALRHQ